MIDKAIENGNKNEIKLPLISQNVHPCSIISLTNGETSITYHTSELYKIKDELNPLTNLPFTHLLKEKIELYYTCLEKFPDYSNIESNIVLFNKWLDTLKYDEVYNEKEKESIQIKARCFLQPEDLVGIYKYFESSNLDKSSFDNLFLDIREEAVKFLKESGRKWILRNSSLIDTKNAKGYVLTIIYKNIPYSFPIVHKFSEGYYYNVSLSRGDSTDKPFTYSSCYVSIIDLLKNALGEQLIIYANN